MKRRLAIVGGLVLLLLVASSAKYDGDVRPIAPRLEAMILGSTTWPSYPNIHGSVADPDAVYAMAPEMPEGDLFSAVRVDVKTGAQTRVRIAIGPETPIRPCQPVKGLRAEVRGVWFLRPRFYLWRFPSGQGPGIERVDSATGYIDVVIDEGNRTRRLLTQPAYNSDRIVLLLALVYAHPDGHWIAAVSSARPGWKLFVFTPDR